MSQPPAPQDEPVDPWRAPEAPRPDGAGPDPYGQPPAPYGQQPPPGYPPPPPPPGYGYGYGAPAYGPPPGHEGSGAPGVPAGFGARFLARLLDGLVGLVLGVVIAIPTGAFDAVGNASSGYTAGYSAGRQIGSTTIAVLLWGVYEVLLVHHRGQTLGMMALGIKVMDERTGQRPSLAASFLRFLVLGGSYLLCFLPFVVVCLSPLFDGTGRERGWHDRAASVRVVKV